MSPGLSKNKNKLTLHPSKKCPAFFAKETFNLSKTNLYSAVGLAVLDSKKKIY